MWFTFYFSKELLAKDEVKYDVPEVQWYLCEDQSPGDSVIHDPSKDLVDYTEYLPVDRKSTRDRPTFVLCSHRTDYLSTYEGLIKTEVCFVDALIH